MERRSSSLGLVCSIVVSAYAGVVERIAELWDWLIDVTAILGTLFLLIAVILIVRGALRKP